MSDTLTDAAPVVETAVAPVGEPAPVAANEADGGSGDRTIPVERFNGLMSSFNKAQARVSTLEAELSELRSGLNSKPEQEKPVPVSDELQASIQQLREELQEERLRNVRREVLDQYPEAKPFADLIVADSPDDLRQMAKLISERVKGVTTTEEAPAGEATGEVAPVEPVVQATEEAPEVPVTGGGSTYDSGAATEDRVVEAIKNRSFKDFLTAKWERQEAALEQAS